MIYLVEKWKTDYPGLNGSPLAHLAAMVVEMETPSVDGGGKVMPLGRMRILAIVTDVTTPPGAIV